MDIWLERLEERDREMHHIYVDTDGLERAPLVGAKTALRKASVTDFYERMGYDRDDDIIFSSRNPYTHLTDGQETFVSLWNTDVTAEEIERDLQRYAEQLQEEYSVV